MFLEWSSTRQMNLLPSPDFDIAMATKSKNNKTKKTGRISSEIISLETIWNIGLRFCRNIVCISVNKFCFSLLLHKSSGLYGNL